MEQTKESCVRVATEKDKEAFYNLWRVCFEDSERFSRWIFENRFYPSYSVCLEKDGTIPSAMQGIPYRIRVRNIIVDGVMLCGVCTHPAYRGKGYMGEIFRFEMDLLREKRALLAVHTPAVLPSYFSYGHLPVADASYFQCEAVPLNFSKARGVWIEEEQWDSLFPCYDAYIAKPFSGAIVRTEEEFLRKCADYGSDGGKSLILKDSKLRGYAFCYVTEKELICVEAVAENGYYYQLLEAICSHGIGKTVSIKLPPNLYLHLPFGKFVRKQKGVAGLVDMRGLLKALDLPTAYTITIFDPVVSENSGNFDFKGEKSRKAPAIALAAGKFLGVLLGYVTLDEVKSSVTIYDQEGYDAINSLLPKCNCYIIDEY